MSVTHTHISPLSHPAQEENHFPSSQQHREEMEMWENSAK